MALGTPPVSRFSAPRQKQAHYANNEMCRLTEQVIFTEPYCTATNNRWASGGHSGSGAWPASDSERSKELACTLRPLHLAPCASLATLGNQLRSPPTCLTRPTPTTPPLTNAAPSPAPAPRWTSPQLDADVAALQGDLEARAAIGELKGLFVGRPQALLHGDLHTGG